jgi:hypothetical protein
METPKMTEVEREVLRVRRAAAKAWDAIERKHRQAVETAIATKREMDKLELIMGGKAA